MKRIILHFDLDYFFAQVEERENPRFKGQPVVVGADPKQGRGRGVVSTCNYEARKFGLRSGMPISRAWKLCPQAVFLPVNMNLYIKVSQQIFKLAQKYSKLLEQMSVDEGYLDLSKLTSFAKAKQVGERLRKAVYKQEQLTVSVGVAPNKMLAKLATESAKPNGLSVITPLQVRAFLDPRGVRAIPGIGPKGALKLAQLNIATVKQLRALSKTQLLAIFGKLGGEFYNYARGIDNRPVQTEHEIKSVGRNHTFDQDTADSAALLQTLEDLLIDSCTQLRAQKLTCRNLAVILRWSNFQTHSKTTMLAAATSQVDNLLPIAKKLFLQLFSLHPERKVRLLGVRCGRLVKL